jgi:tetratricopeptide (TPR) repeat protein
MTALIGQTVSHYKILERLGGGGMGVVYKAQDLQLDRPVALKFLHPDLTRDPEAKQRFIHEAKAASALEHANICSVHEIGDHKSQTFIVMGYYEGETLKSKIEQGPLAIEEAVDIAVQICHGLTKAHERGIIHRDIKPANVIITREGDAKIVDFGLAKLSGTSLLTKYGSRLGTVAYMSPEQARGTDVDARSDLFSLGVVVYEMVTGKRPFGGEHEAALMYCILNLDPPAPTSINQNIPSGLEAIILRLLDKSLANRYQTASEVRADLLRLRDQTGPGGRLRKRASDLKRIYGYVGVIIVLAFLGWLVWPQLFPPASKKQPWRIGILPFQRITQLPEAGDWPMVVQMIMVDQLNGVEELRIIDPFALSNLANGTTPGSPQILVAARQLGATFLVNGTVEALDRTYILRCTLTDVADGSVKMTDAEPFASERELPGAVQNISEQILNYFQIQTLSGSSKAKEDIQPWLSHRTKKLSAVKAFLQGAQFSWRMQPGGERFFRKAIELDSSFITPRTWLISSLVQTGNLPEAQEHQAFLLRHLLDAGPFEQALIRWTGAMIAGSMSAEAKALEEALDYSPNNNVLIYLLADIKYSQEDYAAAALVIRPAVESGWAFQPASLILGTSLFQLREFSQSRKVLERSLTLETVLPETYSFLAALALHDGDSLVFEESAREFIRRSQDEGARSDSIYAFLAGNCAFLGMHRPASAYYSRAIDLSPGKAKYYIGLAQSMIELGNLSRAQEAATRALALDSTSFQIHDLMGRLLDAKRDTSAALRHYLTCLAKDSASLRSKEIRSRISELTRK